MNIQQLDIRAIKSTQTTEKVASSGASLRVRSDLKAGVIVYEKR